MKNNLKIKMFSVLLLVTMLLSGCEKQETGTPHQHAFADATCSAPKTCACGATEGEPLAHEWVEADYSSPRTCTLCGLTEGEKLVSPIPEHLNLALAMEKIPIANQTMTEDELRDIIVQYMYLQINFAYTPDFGDTMDEYGYYIVNLYDDYGCEIPFEEGKYYGGIPYIGNAAGSLYRWLEFYDADSGVMNWEPLIRTRRKNWEAEGIVFSDVGSAYFGNSCSASCVWAWLRVSNKIDGFWTSTWIPERGFVQVGDYKLNSSGNHGSDTAELCKANGNEIMYEAYAKIKRADGLVKSGHAIMSVSDAVVVRTSSGSINPNESYILIAEQTSPFLSALPSAGGVELYSPLGDSGITYRIQGNFAGNVVCGKTKTMKRNFQYLYEQGYLPFTIPELCGQDLVERAKVEIYKSNDKYTASTVKLGDIAGMRVEANYAISDIHFTIRDENGERLFTAMYTPLANDVNTLMGYSLKGALFDNPFYQSKGYINLALIEHAASGKNTLEITARVSTGQLLTVYKGTLTE